MEAVPVSAAPGSGSEARRKSERGPATSDHRPVARLYGPPKAEQEPEPYADRLGRPGEYPFTRGIHPDMYRGRLWTMRQYAGFGTAEDSNRRFRDLLGQGQSGLSTAFDLPTQMGFDADSEWAEGEVGKAGVSICSWRDMDVLLRDIPLDRISLSMTINAPAAILLAMLAAVALERNMPLASLTGTVQNDILKEYVARGTYIFPPAPSLRLATDLIRWCQGEMPRFNPISISGYHIREAGSTAAQEVAFTFAHAKAYVDAVLRAGLPVDAFAGRLSFFFNAHNNLLEEVAKFRAARRLWARIMRHGYGAENPRSWRLRFHTQTGGSTLTAQQPANNIVRVTVQALAAVLGGTQSLHTNSKDEALALPNAESASTALRTQQILAHESGVADTVDPLGGSWYVEHLTDEIEQTASAYLDRIDELGGTLAAVEGGFMQLEIQEAAVRTQRAVEAGEDVIVGVNAYRDEQTGEVADLNLLRVNEQVQADRRSQVRTHRSRRDPSAVVEVLRQVRAAAEAPDGNLMPPILSAVQAGGTVGEICDELRSVWGEYQAQSWI